MKHAIKNAEWKCTSASIKYSSNDVCLTDSTKFVIKEIINGCFFWYRGYVSRFSNAIWYVYICMYVCTMYVQVIVVAIGSIMQRAMFKLLAFIWQTLWELDIWWIKFA